ncbi:helix-turn-helix domain-containing protein [Clostridium sporogenes]|uniref:AraC family transcriptional regulator n=1 Tax=Clostridium sporogenes TaxID=1509 RepID=A0ABX4KBT8_CLOSG|nr:AraC family transcriptional regulator [Clostridium sporogenes]KOY64464.1 AraC family transcriptional regulator [Clostridium sporogenes]MBA4508587.1 helix-turn-helix transcriptional regulator [Clostridium sporogenes]MDU6336619.1 AraC family transcriptional regulator [Clostridium sporogenes]NFF63053.1 helix-turn-helix transcriptional regulator [Clostridium sporogenes]NFH47398.1 helix-turn-helix transcriptional regulator [Clostridium sporogenes]
MELCAAKQYEIKSSKANDCCICDGFNKIYNKGCGQYSYQIPQELGSGHLKQLLSCENARIMEFDMNLLKQVELNGISGVPHIDMLFCLGDDLQWELPQSGKRFEMLSGESYMGTSEENVKRCIYPAKCDVKLIEIKMPLKKMKDNIDKICKDSGFYNYFSEKVWCDNLKITPSINAILHQMLKCPYEESLRYLYMEGKLMELVAVYLNEVMYQSKGVSKSISLSKDDIKSIYKAKNILDRSITQKITLSYLSKEVCLNEFKLKKGFKELFGMPVYTYLLDKRLELAKFFLEEKKFRVSDVANLVGYGNMSHFAAAFRKKYGVNPSEYVKDISK